MKRFHETNKWDDPWYAALPCNFKLAWDYLLSKCDNAGVWVPNPGLANYQIGMPVDWDAFKKELGARVREVRGGKWWVPSFVKFQFGKLGSQARVHQSVVRLLESHGLLRAYELWYSDVTAIPLLSDGDAAPIPQEREKGQEQGQRQEPEQGRGALPESLNRPHIVAVWQRWQNYWSERFNHSDPMPEQIANAHLRLLAGFGAEMVEPALDYTMSAGHWRIPMLPSGGKANGHTATASNGESFRPCSPASNER